MMYNNKLAVAIKANGKVLREFGETVYVPFGQEYTFLIKNLHSVRAQVRVSIDGTDTTDGTWLVIKPNDQIELTRYIKNGNFEQGNRFKFIERTTAIENGPRGAKVDDGLVRIEFQFEKLVDEPKITVWPQLKKPYQYDWNEQFTLARGMKVDMQAKSSTIRSMFDSQSMAVAQNCASSTSASYMSSSSEMSFCDRTEVENDVGITVPGSISDQKFSTVAWFPVESTKHVMVLKLLGETEAGTPVVKPVTVKAKAKCTTCGVTNKATAKFCSQCATSLTIV